MLAEWWLCGLDEAGRGPLAGPVVAAAVVLDESDPIAGLADSKTLSERRREALADLIRARSLAWAVGRAEVEEIDRINILQASLLAMRRALEGIGRVPDKVVVDGNRLPDDLPCAAEAVVGGDACVPCISAASILAKVARDREMIELDARFPGYGLAAHKGYGTRAHLAALAELGPSAIHRRSFAPVRRLLEATAG